MDQVDQVELLSWQCVPALVAKLASEFAVKIAEQGVSSPILQKLAQDSGDPNDLLFGFLPRRPGPVAAMLLGGLAGAGLGYGAGSVASYLFPNTWNKNKLRRTATLAGAGLGIAPGLAYGLLELKAGHGFNSNPLGKVKSPFRPMYMPMPPWDPQAKAIMKNQPRPAGWEPQMEKFQSLQRDYEKVASHQFMTGLGTFRPLDVDAFNQVIWQDPRVAGRLPAPIQAAATGAATSAANLPGKPAGTRYITPLDMGRVAAGMGSGFLSGAIAGAVLGELMGMPRETQDRLKNTGMWAGAVANVVPKIFGG